MVPKWTPKTPEWNMGMFKLLDSGRTYDCPDSTLQEVLIKSQSFPVKLPLDTNTCKTLRTKIDDSVLQRNITSAYPVVHESALFLFGCYIYHKRAHGNSIEKEVYGDMDLPQFIDRLLTKRPVSFYGNRDHYMLMNGQKGAWMAIGTIGTDREKTPLVLKDCLSCEEIKLAAFLSVSSYTYFINVGDRKNCGVFEKQRDKIEDEGVIMGVIGPRLAKPFTMDYQEMVITQEQNTAANGYGKQGQTTVPKLFADFYEEQCMDYEEVITYKNSSNDKERYTVLKGGELFDNFVYYKRLTISLDTLFFEANERARDRKTTALIHVVGIGLGLWKIAPEQDKLFMQLCAERIKLLGKYLPNVSDIRFSYINHKTCGTYKDKDKIPIECHPLGGIKVHIGEYEPHVKLTGSDSGKLLVVSYACDGNALPGNEYWAGLVGKSGDSATACSTQISELHNPFINSKVCGVNLHIVTSDGRILNLEEYRKSATLKNCCISGLPLEETK